MRRCMLVALTVVGALAGTAIAEDPVYFADAKCKQLVETTLGKKDPTPTDMLGLIWFESEDSPGIVSLKGLEYAKNLKWVNLHANWVLSDISALAGLTQLETIEFGHNSIKDMSALAGPTRVKFWLKVDANPLNEDAYCIHLPQIRANNVGIELEYDINANPPRGLIASDGTYPDKVHVTWDALCIGPLAAAHPFYYRVSRSDSQEGPKTIISDWMIGTSFDDTSAVSGTRYWYWVTQSESYDYLQGDQGYAGGPTMRTLTVSSAAGGTVGLPGIGAFQYDQGDAVSASAIAASNHHFVNWTGSAVTAGKVANASASSTTVTMAGDYTLQANFAIDQRTLTVSAGAGGTVSAPGVGSFQYDHGASVSVVGTAASNYHFVNWTGSAVAAGKVANGSAASTTVKMDGDYTLQANFAIDQRTLTVSAGAGGTVSAPGVGSFQYGQGASVSVAATAASNYHFVNWTGSAVTAGKVASAISASTTVTMAGDYTLQANFAIDQRALTVSAGAGGTVSAPGVGSFQYDHGASVSVVGTAASNYHFVNWTGSAVTAGKVASAISASTTVKMDGDYTLRANFAIDQRTLTVSAGAGGTVSAPGVGSFQYGQGASVSVAATAGSNYHFVNWTGSAVTAGKVANAGSVSTTVTMDGDYTLRANFAADQRTLTVGAGAGGTVSAPGVGSFQYDHGTSVSVAATAGSNYHFVNWTGTAVTAGKVASVSSASTTVTMDGDYTLRANFAVDQRTLTVSAGAGGTVSAPGVGGFYYDHGAVVSVAATAASNYHFVNWTGTAVTAGKVADPDAASTTVTTDGNYTLRANFELTRYTLTITSTVGGSVGMPADGVGSYTYAAGELVWISATANPSFTFVGWRGGFYANESQASITMTGDLTVEAHFESILDTIYVDDDAPGDPGPGDANVSDLNQNGTPSHPLDGIQKAIAVAKKRARIVIQPGTYLETIDLLGKSIELDGLSCSDGIIGSFPVINGQGKGTVVTCTQGEDPNCVLSGLVITGGRGRVAGGIVCSGSSPSFVNCLIVGNHLADPNDAGYIGDSSKQDCVNGGALYCKDSNATFVNCTISGNWGVSGGPALGFKDSRATIANSIVWGNGPVVIVVQGTKQPVVAYTDVTGGSVGTGNLNKDPLFAVPGFWASAKDLTKVVEGTNPGAVWVKGDYHVRSQAGRWDPVLGWVKDSATSPCIDAGDPASPIGQEPKPNGLRVNMGAYGGTCQASLSK